MSIEAERTNQGNLTNHNKKRVSPNMMRMLKTNFEGQETDRNIDAFTELQNFRNE